MPAGHEAPPGIAPAPQAPLDEFAGDIELGAAHVFHPAGDDDLGMAALDLHGPETDGIQARTAAPIKGDAGHFHRPTGGQECHAGDIHIFAALVGLPHESRRPPMPVRCQPA